MRVVQVAHPRDFCGLCGTWLLREGSIDIGMPYTKSSTHHELVLSVPNGTC